MKVQGLSKVLPFVRTVEIIVIKSYDDVKDKDEYYISMYNVHKAVGYKKPFSHWARRLLEVYGTPATKMIVQMNNTGRPITNYLVKWEVFQERLQRVVENYMHVKLDYVEEYDG